MNRIVIVDYRRNEVVLLSIGRLLVKWDFWAALSVG